MFFYIIKWFFIYFILILLLHYLYKFIEKNFTSTNIKDYVNNSKYELDNINKILNNNDYNNDYNNNNNNNNNNNDNINSFSDFDNYNLNSNNINDNNINIDNNNMESELETFIKELI
tara:strand:+ start:606 stop:956 length:351 start_codon:yes stop_codon:yes gene_type:complete